MRNNGILNIDVARADLPMQPEYWIEETYVSRYEKLLRVIEKKTSFLPYRNTKVIREISFEVPASTTLEQIKEVSLAFEKRFKVSCFQISIDRSVQVAHLLFAWIDMETGKAVKLDVNTLKRATGMFLRRLKLPHPKDYDKWIRYVPMRNVQMSSSNNTGPFARKTKRLKAVALSEMPLPMSNL